MGIFSQKKFKEQKNFFFAYDNLWTRDKTNPTRGPNPGVRTISCTVYLFKSGSGRCKNEHVSMKS